MRRYPAQFGTDYAPSCCVKRSYAGLLSWSIVTGSGRTALVRNGKATHRASSDSANGLLRSMRSVHTVWCDQISTPAENQLRFTSQALAPYFFRFLWCRRIGHDADRSPPPERRAATMRDSQPMIAKPSLSCRPAPSASSVSCSSRARPSDDNITSKAGRCDLVSAGPAFHEAGLSSLTPDGVRLAREWDLCSLYARRDRRWYLKVRANPRPEGAAVSHSESGAPARQDRSEPATPDRARILWRRYPLHRNHQWEGLLATLLTRQMAFCAMR